jgi:hypothetical protein
LFSGGIGMKNQKVYVSATKKKATRKRRKLKRSVKITLALLLLSVWMGITCYKIGFAQGSKYAKETVKASEQQSKEDSATLLEKNNESVKEKFVFNPDIPMPEKHQRYLFEKCKERGLDYKKTLALIQHESNYNPNAVSDTMDYGYFQINEINRAELAKKLNTPDSPLNPYINMDWGTYILAELYEYWEEKGVTGEELDRHVWSSYHKGIKGFKENGEATSYIKKVEAALLTLR